MNSTVKISGRFSKSRGLRASVPFFPLPHPLPSTVLLLPHFSRATRMTPLRGPNFVRFVRERLLRRLVVALLCGFRVRRGVCAFILSVAVVVSHAHVLRLVTRGEERVTSLRTSAIGLSRHLMNLMTKSNLIMKV